MQGVKMNKTLHNRLFLLYSVFRIFSVWIFNKIACFCIVKRITFKFYYTGIIDYT
jgi:hypothetical protein